jgi:copper transport protein
MAVLSIATLELVSYQGHASQAPLATLSVFVDSLHLGAVAIWLGGLPFLALVLRQAPRVLPEEGRGLAAAVLARFSTLAFAAVGVIALTGLARAVGQLSAPTQLWDTAYGRSLIYKSALLWPIAFLAFKNRKLLVALARVRTPPVAALVLVRRNLAIELAIGTAIVVVAALLAAQIPGRV